MRHLDVSRLRSHQRIVTQTISLELVSQGKAGIRYRSNLDSEDCLAVFDTAVTPTRYGRDQTIEADDDDLGAWPPARGWRSRSSPRVHPPGIRGSI
jgi:hypothetical protein